MIRPCSFQDPEPEGSNQTTTEPPITTILGPCPFQDPEPESNSYTVSTIPIPPRAKPIPAPHCKSFARPLEQPKLVCTSPAPTTPLMATFQHILPDKNPHTTTTPTDPVPESTLSSPATRTSTSSSSDSDETQSTDNTSSTDDTQSTHIENSIASTVSARQLCPINYNETLFKRLCGNYK